MRAPEWSHSRESGVAGRRTEPGRAIDGAAASGRDQPESASLPRSGQSVPLVPPPPAGISPSRRPCPAVASRFRSAGDTHSTYGLDWGTGCSPGGQMRPGSTPCGARLVESAHPEPHDRRDGPKSRPPGAEEVALVCLAGHKRRGSGSWSRQRVTCDHPMSTGPPSPAQRLGLYSHLVTYVGAAARLRSGRHHPVCGPRANRRPNSMRARRRIASVGYARRRRREAASPGPSQPRASPVAVSAGFGRPRPGRPTPRPASALAAGRRPASAWAARSSIPTPRPASAHGRLRPGGGRADPATSPRGPR
jgi:hypothetical protein